jgi:hypothetical protein
VRELALVRTPLCGEPGSGVQTTVAASDGALRATASKGRSPADSRRRTARFTSRGKATQR